MVMFRSRIRRWLGMLSGVVRVVGDAFAWAAWLSPVVIFGLMTWVLYCATVRPGLFPVRAPVIDRMESPGWFSGDDASGIENKISRVEGHSLYDGEVAEALAGALAADPWVSEVRYVRRRFPSSLDCEVAVRRPFAAVEVGRKLFIVDRAGVRLPMPPQDAPHAGMPMVLGIKSYPPGPGDTWKDPAVAAGLLVLARTVDLAEATGNNDLRVIGAEIWSKRKLPGVILHTVSGTRINWGAVYRPGREPYGAPTTDERVLAVREVIDEFGADAVKFVDVSVLPASYRAR